MLPLIDNEAAALARMPEDSRNPIEDAFVAAWARRMQQLDGVAQALYWERSIEVAVGAQLDGLGSIVGEPRNGRDDEPYRLRLRVRVLLNLTSGSADEILRILRMIIPVDSTLVLEEQPPAAMLLHMGGGELPLPLDVYEVAVQAKAAGVRLFLVLPAAEDDELFTFKGGSGLGFPVDQPGAVGPVVATGGPAMSSAAPTVVADVNNPAPFAFAYQLEIRLVDAFYVSPPINAIYRVEFEARLSPAHPFTPYIFEQYVSYSPDIFQVSILLPGGGFSGLAIYFNENQSDSYQPGVDSWACSCTAASRTGGGRLVGVLAG